MGEGTQPAYWQLPAKQPRSVDFSGQARHPSIMSTGAQHAPVSHEKRLDPKKLAHRLASTSLFFGLTSQGGITYLGDRPGVFWSHESALEQAALGGGLGMPMLLFCAS